ncbi:MAG TPA: acetate uptake transporter [Anseongella sp.]|nr:acetate uptake transporter [Anseongella sp.]
MNENTHTVLRDTSANPASLGLFAFGICTILLSLINAGIMEMDSMLLSMGLFYGGIAQILVGVMEAKKGNTFGLTAFTSYGIFWLTFVAMNVMPELGWMKPASRGGMVAFLVMWGIFTVLLFIATLKLNRALQVLFGTLIILFILLVAGTSSANAAIIRLAGYEGILVGLVAMYFGTAGLLNEVYGRTLLPLGERR